MADAFLVINAGIALVVLGYVLALLGDEPGDTWSERIRGWIGRSRARAAVFLLAVQIVAAILSLHVVFEWPW